MKFIGAQLSVGEIGVGSFVNPPWKRCEAKLIAKAGSLEWPVSRPRPSRTIFREWPLLAAKRTFSETAKPAKCQTFANTDTHFRYSRECAFQLFYERSRRDRKHPASPRCKQQPRLQQRWID
jgi:hypothetical protein